MSLANDQPIYIALITDRPKSEPLRTFTQQLRHLRYEPQLINAISPQVTRSLAPPNLVLLDMAFRDIESAVSLPRNVRAVWEYIPIILFTDETEVDRLRLEAQYMDFLTLQISLPMLDMRLRFCRLRCNGVLSPTEVIEVAGVAINLATREVTLNKRNLALTFKEFELLHFFFTRPRRAYTRAELLAAVWETDSYGDTRTVDMHIQRLRVKLGTRAGNMIHTIRNVGYRFG